MFDDSSDKDRKKKSLLSHDTSGARPALRGGSLLAVSATPEEDDPVARHRLARSRREAEPSPLLSALAKMEGVHLGPTTADPAAAQPAAGEPKKSRWNLRDLLSPKLKYDPPEPGPAADPKPTFVQAPPSARAGASASKAPEASGQDTTAAREPRSTSTSARKRPTEPFATSRSNSREGGPVEAPRAMAGEEFDSGIALAGDAAPDDPHWRPLVDPMRVIGGVFNSKALILAATIAGGLIGVMIALSTPKKYEAFSELLVDPRDLKVSDRDLTQTGLTSDALLALVENQVRLMTSGTVLNKVVERLRLEDDPEFNGQRKAGGMGNFIASLRALLSRNGAGGDDNRRALAVENLARAITVERSGKTFIVTVSAKTEGAEKSAEVVNTVDQVFLETSGELQSDTAGRAADELTARLEELRAGVEEAERKVETFKAENDLIGAQGRLISDDELVKLNDQLATARAQTIELNARAQSVRSIRVDSVIGGGLPEELSSPVMSELRAQYASIKQEADRLSVRLGPRHPQYLAAQAQLQGAREQIENELRRIVATVQTQLKRAVQLEQDLAARLAQLKVRSGDVNGDLVTLRELEREAAAKRAVYENYLLRAKEAGEQRGINTANISVISQAFPPLDPTGPSRATIAMTGAALGFFAGIALGMARGIFWSLRDKSRSHRARLVSRTPAPGTTTADHPHRAQAENAPEAFDASANPLARLIERIRWPSRAAAAGKAGPARAASDSSTRSESTAETEIAGQEARASQEPADMYPYPYHQPAYPQQPSAQATPYGQQQAAYPQQPMAQPAPYPQPPVQPASYQAYPQAFAQPPHYPPAFAPQPAAHPYPAAMPPQPAFHGWQPQPAMSPYGYPQPAATPYPPYPQAAPQPAYPQEARPVSQPEPRGRDMSPIEEVRESLREFREAIRDLVEDRARRRYS